MNSQEYLLSHGLRREYVESEFGWKIAEKAIAMPTKDKSGTVIHNCYRHLEESIDPDNPTPKFKRDYGSTPSLYGIDRVSDIEEVVYCEGQPDCVRLWQEGIAAVTSDGGAESLTGQMAAQLKDKIVNLCMDSDEAGQKVVKKYYELLSKYAKLVRIVEIPKEFKDVTEVFQAGCDADLFKKILIESPTRLDDWMVNNAPEEHRVETIGELFNAEIPKETWIVDKILPAVGISVFAGAAGTGKSFLSLDMARAIAVDEEWLNFKIMKKVKTLFLDKENERGNFRNRCRGLKMQDCKDSIYRMIYPEQFDLFTIENKQIKFSQFAEEIAALVRSRDIGLIVFDSYVDFMPGDENSASDTQELFNGIRKLLPGGSILFLAHYTKAKEGDFRSPLERIAGSRNIGAQITSGLAIESSKEADNEIIVSMIKARNTAKNTTKYKVLMNSSGDLKSPGDTLVTRFKFDGEVIPTVEKMSATIEMITNMVDEAGVLGVKRKDAHINCSLRH